MKTLLLVEDNPDEAELTTRAFRKHDPLLTLELAEDGALALARLRTDGPLPDLVLLDLKLPKVEGLEVLRQLRRDERTRLLPVVVLTSSVEEQDVLESYRSGCNSYVRKPVSYEEFLQTARDLGVYWLRLNHPPPGLPG